MNKHHHVQSDECRYSCDVHRGERPYSCEVSNKAFIVKSARIIHERLHRGEHTYSCEVCNKAFSFQSHLIKHKRVHSGERPYVCDVCNKDIQCQELPDTA